MVDKLIYGFFKHITIRLRSCGYLSAPFLDSKSLSFQEPDSEIEYRDTKCYWRVYFDFGLVNGFPAVIEIVGYCLEGLFAFCLMVFVEASSARPEAHDLTMRDRDDRVHGPEGAFFPV